MAKQLNELMNRQVANLGLFFVKLHNYHWLVKGKQFFRLHDKFEEMYDEVNEFFDEVAERMLMLGETPVATLKEFLEHASVKEASGKETSLEMVEVVLNDLILMDKELAQATALAEDNDDHVTADLFIGMRENFQKHIWMLKTFME